MLRTPWGDDINNLRPRPFNRATGILPYIDNFYGEKIYGIDIQADWIRGDVFQPWECWILPLSERPSIREEQSPSRFLTAPYPCFHRGHEFIYLRNLAVTAISTSHTLATVPIRLGTSIYEEAYDPNYQIYASTDSWDSWYQASPATVNSYYTPLTGTVEIIYRLPSAITSVTQVAGSTLTPQFWPIFNALDERGLEVNLPRLAYEDNTSYSTRLNSVLALPSNRNQDECAASLARRLGTLEVISWPYMHIEGNFLLNLQDLGSGMEHTGDLVVYDSWTHAQADGLRRQALSFTTITSSLILTPSTVHATESNQRSLSLWVNPSETTVATSYLLENNSFGLYIINDNLGLQGLPSVCSIATGEWTHLGLSCAGTYATLSLNGVVKYEGALTWGFDISLGWTIGSGFVGLVDEIQVRDTVFSNPLIPYYQIIPNGAYPTFVIGAMGNIPKVETITESLVSINGAWKATNNIEAPYDLYSGEHHYSSFTVSGDTVTTGPLTGVYDISLAYTKTNWSQGTGALIPENIGHGLYSVYIANGVTPYSLKTYIEDFLTDASTGLLTDRGRTLLESLGPTLTWESRVYGENLYLYENTPPLSSTQERWDQDLQYS